MKHGVEKVVIVGIATKLMMEFYGKLRHMEIEQLLIWAIGRFTRPKRRR